MSSVSRVTSLFPGLNLYAELSAGVVVPVALVPQTNSYQVSWVKEHNKAQTGTINIKMYDNEGYVAYRKAQRNQGKGLRQFYHTGNCRIGFVVIHYL